MTCEINKSGEVSVQRDGRLQGEAVVNNNGTGSGLMVEAFNLRETIGTQREQGQTTNRVGCGVLYLGVSFQICFVGYNTS